MAERIHHPKSAEKLHMLCAEAGSSAWSAAIRVVIWSRLTSRAYFKLHNKFVSFSGILRLALYSDTVPKKKCKRVKSTESRLFHCAVSVFQPSTSLSLAWEDSSNETKPGESDNRSPFSKLAWHTLSKWNCTMTPWCHLSWKRSTLRNLWQDLPMRHVHEDPWTRISETGSTLLWKVFTLHFCALCLFQHVQHIPIIQQKNESAGSRTL